MTEQDDGSSVDWKKCILPQETTSEPLQCPGNSQRSDIECGTGYHTLAGNILQFSEIRSLPIPINGEKLDEGRGIAETLMQRKAKLHKSCRDKFSNMKLKRADKRKRQEEPESPQRSKFTWACSGTTTSKAEKSCFFCGSYSETLHEASTFNIIRYKGSRLRASVARQGVNCETECRRYDFSRSSLSCEMPGSTL